MKNCVEMEISCLPIIDLYLVLTLYFVLYISIRHSMKFQKKGRRGRVFKYSVLILKKKIL